MNDVTPPLPEPQGEPVELTTFRTVYKHPSRIPAIVPPVFNPPEVPVVLFERFPAAAIIEAVNEGNCPAGRVPVVISLALTTTFDERAWPFTVVVFATAPVT